ncbi:MAG: hypothetical protein FWG47_04620, partial [Propionibacteriaceae bacterium]|nr:hypothetical protein [Propionibacteriaceae bacterium]
PSLRAVLVIPERPQIVARFIFDDSPGIEEYKTVAMVESEVRADFADVRNIHARHIHKSTDEIGVSFTTVNISAPKKIDYLPGEINAYARKESNS